jgi:hypothetical protein
MIQVFVRHCHFSSISQHKKRWPNFSREKCHQNLLQTIDLQRASVTFLLDTYHQKGLHFLEKETAFPIKKISEGTESGSFLRLLDHIETLKLDPETILYFLEDDYLHRAGWLDVLIEGMQLPGVDYVTLYDHKDKYFLPMYEQLRSKIFVSPTCHWRTVPSTTHTFAVRWKRLKKDLAIHRKYSVGRKISQDHEKFSFLTRGGATLISPMPGWSTHAEIEFASPCIEWEDIINTQVFTEELKPCKP